MGRGIDYGMGQTNIDRDNGIRFGVICAHDLAHWCGGEFEADYGDPACPKCGNPAFPGHADYPDYRRGCCHDYFCDDCEIQFGGEDAYGDEPVSHALNSDGYVATLDSYNDVFITKSPYFTRAAFCSPCAPGACHLSSPTEEGERAYCFGHDWFEDKVAPYPVYSVETGELVPPPAK
jgi:hypothetical protein